MRAFSQMVRKTVKQEPRMMRIRVNRFTQIRLVRGYFSWDGMIDLAVSLSDDLHVVLYLVLEPNPVVLINRAFTCVVAREREFDVTCKSLQQPAQVLRARSNILFRIVRMFTPKPFRRRWHQLHPPLGARV